MPNNAFTVFCKNYIYIFDLFSLWKAQSCAMPVTHWCDFCDLVAMWTPSLFWHTPKRLFGFFAELLSVCTLHSWIE